MSTWLNFRPGGFIKIRIAGLMTNSARIMGIAMDGTVLEEAHRAEKILCASGAADGAYLGDLFCFSQT